MSTYEEWTGSRNVPVLGTNSGTTSLAFQGWHQFKEAFAPELVARAAREMTVTPKTCFDPFGGSGTTALACQFLGIRPTTIELNPYLADLIEAKLVNYDISQLAKDVATVVKQASEYRADAESLLVNCPKTFLEPGKSGKWVFNSDVAERILAIRACIERIPREDNRRLMRVILGGQLVGLSNVRISGKGRRYRSNWAKREIPPNSVLEKFLGGMISATKDIEKYSARKSFSYKLLRGDVRKTINKVRQFDLSVFSPPYPNSFDYTDVYNLELWTLGYLTTPEDNTQLRKDTISSHVQLRRTYEDAPKGSPLLDSALDEIGDHKDSLWNSDIPLMLGAYFHELNEIIEKMSTKISEGGRIYIVVGDSSYANVRVAVADIIFELAGEIGFSVRKVENLRNMRSSAQQGSQLNLAENLVILG